MKNIVLGCISFFILLQNSFSQEKQSQQQKDFQVTFGYPLGTNGIQSTNFTNKYSFNILYGLNGGVDGFELGSILNFCKQKVRGCQISGVTNYNESFTDGVIVAGVNNICLDSSNGIFVSGVANYAQKSAKGLQLSTVNIATDKMNGSQIGVFNYAKKLKGVQIGVINYCENSENALPIGLFSIVKNGLFELELMGGETVYSNLNYKMGVNSLYTIFKIGMTNFKNANVISYGIGMGSKIYQTNKQSFTIDISTNQIVFKQNFDADLNLLNKIDFSYQYDLTKNLSFILGPSINVYISKLKIENTFGSLPIPYSIYNNVTDQRKITIWAGFNLGFTVKL